VCASDRGRSVADERLRGVENDPRHLFKGPEMHGAHQYDEMIENFLISLHDKLMGQVNTVLVGQSWLNHGGSFTLTSGISAHEPVHDGSNASCVNLALEGFLRGAAVDLKRGMRINLISPTMLEESVALFSAAFPGFAPVSSARVGLA